jgi:hypothetical protein
MWLKHVDRLHFASLQQGDECAGLRWDVLKIFFNLKFLFFRDDSGKEVSSGNPRKISNFFAFEIDQ